jgi:CheY-like chemotaxis protein
MKLTELIILVAEDDENDVLLFQRAIRKAVTQRAQIHVVCDGQECLDYLRGLGRFSDRKAYPLPNLLILDNKMPRVSGLDVLEWLHDHDECAVIPTMMFSSSDDPREIMTAYRLGVNAYFRKPLNHDDVMGLLSDVFKFWMRSEVPFLPAQSVCT